MARALGAIAAATGSKVVHHSFKAYSDKLRAWEKQRQRAILNGARSGLRLARKDAMRRFAQHGIGRRIWGKEFTGRGGVTKRSNLPTFIKLERLRWFGGKLTSALKAKGIPALVEKGGRTKPHRILPIKSSVAIKSMRREARHAALKLTDEQVASGLVGVLSAGKGKGFIARYVQHPGSRIAPRPSLYPALRAHERIIVEKIDERLQRSLEQGKVA